MCNLSELVEERGFEKGYAEGIRIFVEALKELNIADDYILKKVMEKFDLSAEEAKKYV